MHFCRKNSQKKWLLWLFFWTFKKFSKNALLQAKFPEKVPFLGFFLNFCKVQQKCTFAGKILRKSAFFGAFFWFFLRFRKNAVFNAVSL
jgi:hypothetical protein